MSSKKSRRWWLGLTAAIASAVLVAACGSTSGGSTPSTTPSGSTQPQPSASASPSYDPALTKFYTQKLSWKTCGSPWQCTTLKVPLDYSDPSGATISLQVVKRPASNSSQRIGSLVVNPGGPGGSGIEYARAGTSEFSKAVLEHYDLVGFDPRGVASSDPIECLTDAQTDQFVSADGNPQNAAEIAQVVQIAKMLGAGCEKMSPKLVAHVGTRDAARDMDILRAALGDQKLNYLGKSYGTFLGETYADLFPTHVGRMVIDGVIDPTLTNDGLVAGQAAGFQLALGRFIANCPSHSDCPLSHNSATALSQINAFLARSHNAPLIVDGRQLTQSLATLAVAAGLYDPPNGWENLRIALSGALAGDGSTMLQLADFYTSRNSDGTYQDNSNEAQYAVNCLDRPQADTIAHTQALATQLAQVSSTFGVYLAWGNLPCASWPAQPTDTPHAIHAVGAPTILVVGTTHDPATPYPWAVATAKQLSKAVLLTWTGDGHTAYFRGSSCIDNAVDAFLINDMAPAAGLVCS